MTRWDWLVLDRGLRFWEAGLKLWLVGRWGGEHRAGLHQGLQSFKGNTFNSENRVLGRPRFSEKHNPT